MDRRRFLQGAVGAGLILLSPRCRTPWADWGDQEPPPIEIPDGWDYPVRPNWLPFGHGVASGDPTGDRVVLWTRLTFPDQRPGPVEVRWRVATGRGMKHVVAQGTVSTGPHRDWTVKVDVSGLQPGTTYYYDFGTTGWYSPVGRTRTAPNIADGMNIGVVACSSYWSGYWNAYNRLAERDDLDLVVHCGDHIYDTVDPEEWVRARGNRFDETYVDFRPWQNLDEVRRRYALHYADLSLGNLHLNHPMTIAWDNHDIARGGSTDPMAPRQAFWEWTPCRPPDPVVAPDGNLDPSDVSRDHRHIRYGEVDLFVLDLRSRQDQQTILGAEQRSWFESGLRGSADEGVPWRLVVNPIPIADLRLGTAPYGGWTDRPDDQESMLRFLLDNRIDDCLFLSGDAHGAVVADLPPDQGPDGYDPVTGAGSAAVEILGNSVSRGGLDETLADALYSARYGGSARSDRERFEALLPEAGQLALNLEAQITADNPSLRFINWRDHGYGMVRLTPETATLEQWLVPHLQWSGEETLAARFTVARGTNHAVRVDT